MAETIQKILEKKRVLSSSSEETSPPIRTSKNRKKPRGSTFTFNPTSNHEGDTSSTPEMSTNLDAKLETILLKLEKLDAIETSVKGLQDTLARMDDRIRALERVQATSNQDINDLKDSLSFAEDQQRKTTEGFDRYKEQINLKMTELCRKNAELDSNIKELENRNLYLEAYSILNLRTSKKKLDMALTKKTPKMCFVTSSKHTSVTKTPDRSRCNVYTA